MHLLHNVLQSSALKTRCKENFIRGIHTGDYVSGNEITVGGSKHRVGNRKKVRNVLCRSHKHNFPCSFKIHSMRSCIWSAKESCEAQYFNDTAESSEHQKCPGLYR